MLHCDRLFVQVSITAIVTADCKEKRNFARELHEQMLHRVQAEEHTRFIKERDA